MGNQLFQVMICAISPTLQWFSLVFLWLLSMIDRVMSVIWQTLHCLQTTALKVQLLSINIIILVFMSNCAWYHILDSCNKNSFNNAETSQKKLFAINCKFLITTSKNEAVRKKIVDTSRFFFHRINNILGQQKNIRFYIYQTHWAPTF